MAPKHPPGPAMTLGNVARASGINRKRDVTSPYKRDGELRRKRRLQARIARPWVLVGEGRVAFRDVRVVLTRVFWISGTRLGQNAGQRRSVAGQFTTAVRLDRADLSRRRWGRWSCLQNGVDTLAN
jgi:hypothetical protein